MPPRNAKKRQSRGSSNAAPPFAARSARSLSLLILVAVDFVVALLMLASLIGFVIDPDPAIEAVPMYVTLALATSAALLMLFLALNASFFRIADRRRAKDLRLVMWTMGATAIVTGLLTLGGDADGIVTRLFIGAVAFIFLRVQEARIQRAQAVAPETGAEPAPQVAPVKSRQRRGGRRH
jgi:amino acid transporter